MRRAACLIGVVTALVAVCAAPASAQTADADRTVVVVGVPDLQWSDVTEAGTPALWALAGRGAVGSLSIRAAAPQTGRYDGWLTFGAGNRARAPEDPAVPAGGLPGYLAAAAGSNSEPGFD